MADQGLSILAVAFKPRKKRPAALKFWWQSILELREKLNEHRIQLVILDSDPELALPAWAKGNDCKFVVTTPEENARGIQLENAVEKGLGSVKLLKKGQRTLVRVEDLPFDLRDLPMVFGAFRKKVDVKKLLRSSQNPSLERLSGFQPSPPLQFPALSETSISDIPLPWGLKGGFSAGQRRVQYYLFESRSMDTYQLTRNGMLNLDDSSKFSPWLADGSLSPLELGLTLIKYEETYGSNDSIDWFWQELLWRDYFKFLARKAGRTFFEIGGLRNKEVSWNPSEELFRRWTEGETGQDFVDANMRELHQTGWMSNRGRQNVASYLAKEIVVPWTWGADWFEENLIDEDPENNWGNWLYLAGVGTDPRDRKFNVADQAERYDPQKTYRLQWLQRNPGSS